MHLLFPIRYQIELAEPGRCLAIAGCAIVSAWRQRTAGADLGTVRDRAALELAESEKAGQENPKIRFDLPDIVLPALVGLDFRPGTEGRIAPRAVSQECNLGRRIAESQDVVQMKVLEFVGTDHRLGR